MANTNKHSLYLEAEAISNQIAQLSSKVIAEYMNLKYSDDEWVIDLILNARNSIVKVVAALR